MRILSPAKLQDKSKYLFIFADLRPCEKLVCEFPATKEIIIKIVPPTKAKRLDFSRKAFSDLGFTGEELEMRTRLFVCYQSWEQIKFWKESKSKLKKMIDARIDLLVKK